jgi:hypothetical protein
VKDRLLYPIGVIVADKAVVVVAKVLSDPNPLEAAFVSDSFTIVSPVSRVRPMPTATKSPTLPEVVVMDGDAADASMPVESGELVAEADIDSDRAVELV